MNMNYTMLLSFISTAKADSVNQKLAANKGRF